MEDSETWRSSSLLPDVQYLSITIQNQIYFYSS